MLQKSSSVMQLVTREKQVEDRCAQLTEDLASNSQFVRETKDRLNVAERIVMRQNVRRAVALGNRETQDSS